jgi:hypothetical protein
MRFAKAFGRLIVTIIAIFAHFVSEVFRDFFKWTDDRRNWIVALATVVIALLTYEYATYAKLQWATMQQQLEMAERPFVAPSAFVFNQCSSSYINIENFGHKPVKISIWIGRTSSDKLLAQSPTPLDPQPMEVVIPNTHQGNRIAFNNAGADWPNSFCYLSGFIEYQFLGRHYCTRFCRYMKSSDPVEHTCDDLLTNDLAEDKGCNQYDADLSKQP